MAEVAFEVIDGQEASYYRKEKESDTIGGHVTKVPYVLIDSLAYLGKDRTTTTGAAEELTIPAGSKRVIISCAPSSEAYIEINGDASTSSPLYLEDPFGPLILDLGGVTKLSAYAVAGNLGAVFFG